MCKKLLAGLLGAGGPSKTATKMLPTAPEDTGATVITEDTSGEASGRVRLSGGQKRQQASVPGLSI